MRPSPPSPIPARAKSKTISVVIADAHFVVRAGLLHLLSARKNIHVVGTADNGREAVRLVKQFRPDVVIMDIVMPRLPGLMAARQIYTITGGGTQVLFLTARSDDYTLEQAVRARMSGFLLKCSGTNKIAEAVQSIARGQTIYSPSVAQRLKRHLKIAGYATTEPSGLTEREQEVFCLVGSGMSDKQVAAEIGISTGTTHAHLSTAMKKTGVHDRSGVTRYVMDAGWI